MQGLIGVTRIYLKHAAILLATGLLFQLAALHSGAQDKPKRPRITGIDHVRVYVSNVDKSRAFYSKTIGLPSCDVAGTCFRVGWHPSQELGLEQTPSDAPKN